MPQEIEVYYILPTIRKYLAFSLKEQGMPQKNIADLLLIRESTVSHYINKKRGNFIQFNTLILNEIKKSASKIKNKLDFITETQHLLKLIRETRTLCEIHKKLSAVIPSTCDPFKTGCLPYQKCT